ncbi:OmpA family protein [Rhizobium sp. PP-CC-2G-626]|nr:OmpA family protein [Rhizobium sp. PP-CC-2G-626]
MNVAEPATKLEHKGYNRGLILGLTMAESMLLLVFCLLLVAGAIIKAERQKTSVAEAAAKDAESQIVRLNEEARRKTEAAKAAAERVAELERSLRLTSSTAAEREALDKEWRELVKSRDALRQFEAQGLTPEAVAEAKEVLRRIEDLGLQTANGEVLEQRLRQLMEAERQQAQSKPHEWPPIINLSEAGGYFFKSGSAELTDQFRFKLQGSIASEIARSLDQYDVDIIEVIGHTDEQPISRTGSNLDKTIIDVVDGQKPITAIVPADNAGLGMARALAVVNVLRSEQRLREATILPMSGAQLVLPGDKLTVGQAGNVEARRRIEIRVRRRNDG